MQPRSLDIAPPRAALITQHPNGLTYVRGAIASPICVSVAVFGACLGLGYAGIVGAGIALLAVLVLGAMSARYGFVQRHLDRQAQLRERGRRESARLRALRPSGVVRQTQYLELRDLVETIEGTDPGEAQRFELQDLLDHYTQRAVRHQRCFDALRLAGGTDLPVAIPITNAGKSKRRREIQARRIRHRDECMHQLEALADELDGVDELIRLIAQRTACPTADQELDREIERRLWELDEVDAALHQLSA